MADHIEYEYVEYNEDDDDISDEDASLILSLLGDGATRCSGSGSCNVCGATANDMGMVWCRQTPDDCDFEYSGEMDNYEALRFDI